MYWTNWSDFWAMGGQAYYVWMSFGALLVALAVEAAMLRLRRARALEGIEEERELEAEN
jgi:heme exporter protein CcmD